MHQDIVSFNAPQAPEDRTICDTLAQEIDACLLHGSDPWFVSLSHQRVLNKEGIMRKAVWSMLGAAVLALAVLASPVPGMQ